MSIQDINRILIAVAKAPVPGQAKTRLAGAIGFDAAANLYRCLLLDTLEGMRQIPAIIRAVAYFPADAQETFRMLAPDMLLLPQVGKTLNERLSNLIATSLHNGYQQAGVLSSDTPLIDPAAIGQGFAVLNNGYDVALGPCDDGGYYLLATHTPCALLFDGICMSTPTVAAETIAAAERAGLKVALLPSTIDVDTLADLVRLQDMLQTLPKTVAPHTRTWLTVQAPRQSLLP